MSSSRVVLAAIDRDDAIFPLSAAAVGVLAVERDNVGGRLDDAPGRAVPRNPERLAGHDRIFLVRPQATAKPDHPPSHRFGVTTIVGRA
jgi:hypothetical protein